MTLATCERLLAHYEKIGNKEGIAEMKAHIVKKGGVSKAAPVVKLSKAKG